jgi:hypothetical protein
MSDADFAEAVLRHLEKLDTACLDFIEADSANPRDDAALRVVQQRFRDVDACKAELLSHDLLRLDGLAMNVLQSSPGEWSVRFRDDLVGQQSANVSDLHERIRRRHPSLHNLAKLLRGKGNDAPADSDRGVAEQTPATAKQKLKQPSDDAIACYRLLLATGKTQSELAEIMSRELRRPVDQPQVSRWLKQVKEWLKGGNVLPDLTADSGPKRKVVPIDPVKIDRRDGMKGTTRPRRSEDADRDDELRRLIGEQQDEDEHQFDPIQDEDD